MECNGFYYLRGKWIHGPQFKYPAMRFAGVAEKKISPHLYLKWDGSQVRPEVAPKPPRLIAKHADTTLERMNSRQNGNPFPILQQV